MTRWLLPVLYAVSGLLTVATMAGALLSTPQGPSFLAGASHPLLGIEHFLALLIVGLWAGRLGARTPWLWSSSLLAGMAIGFLLARPGSLAAVEPVIELGMLVATGALAVAMALALRPPPLDAAGGLVLLGICHGVTDRVEAGAAEAWPFVVGYLAVAAMLLALGAVIGQVSPQTR